MRAKSTISLDAVELEHVRGAARRPDLDLAIFAGRTAEITSSLAAIKAATVDGLVVADDLSIEARVPEIIALAADRQFHDGTSFRPFMVQSDQKNANAGDGLGGVMPD